MKAPEANLFRLLQREVNSVLRVLVHVSLDLFVANLDLADDKRREYLAILLQLVGSLRR